MTRTPSPYDQWKKDHFADGTPEDQTVPDACPAGDGITNLMKYAAGWTRTSPAEASRAGGQEETGPPVLEWPVNTAATDVTFSVESTKTWLPEGGSDGRAIRRPCRIP
ncbi:MAG: hypothetical protein ACLT8E_05460 [Akkermansia sp.]